jgi:hypothetical protein
MDGLLTAIFKALGKFQQEEKLNMSFISILKKPKLQN